MSTIDVIRRRPPEVQRCRGAKCGRLVEWVVTAANGRRMPVTHPLCALREVQHDAGDWTVIDAAQVHFNTCPASDTFRKTRRPAPRRPKGPVQGDLFEEPKP